VNTPTKAGSNCFGARLPSLASEHDRRNRQDARHPPRKAPDRGDPDDYTDLDRAQIEAAIEYYETHPELMDYIRMRKRAHERAIVEESRGPNPDS
jgi:hypothetical protein